MDSVAEECKWSKACARDVSEHLEVLSTIPLQDASSGRQKKVTESSKICWLLAKYSIETLAKVCQSISSPPIGRTELQQQHNTTYSRTGWDYYCRCYISSGVCERTMPLFAVSDCLQSQKKMSSPLCLVHLHRYAMRVVVTLLELLRLEIQHLPVWTPGVSELSGVSYTAVSWLLAGCTRKA